MASSWNLFSRQNTVHYLHCWQLIFTIYRCNTFGFAANCSCNCWNFFLMSSKTWFLSPLSPPWGLIQAFHWKSGIGWACCQLLLQFLNSIFNFIKNHDWFHLHLHGDWHKLVVESAGNMLTQYIAWLGNKLCKRRWWHLFWSVESWRAIPHCEFSVKSSMYPRSSYPDLIKDLLRKAEVFFVSL